MGRPWPSLPPPFLRLWTDTESFSPDSKYNIATFTVTELKLFTRAYVKLHPSREQEAICFPNSYKKMCCATINGQKVSAGQYVSAKSVLSFGTNNPGVRPAKVLYFICYCNQIETDQHESIPFAVVNWPMTHQLKDCIGKPYEIWCDDVYETCDKNTFVPVTSILTTLLTAQHVIEDVNVLVTVPLVV